MSAADTEHGGFKVASDFNSLLTGAYIQNMHTAGMHASVFNSLLTRAYIQNMHTAGMHASDFNSLLTRAYIQNMQTAGIHAMVRFTMYFCSEVLEINKVGYFLKA